MIGQNVAIAGARRYNSPLEKHFAEGYAGPAFASKALVHTEVIVESVSITRVFSLTASDEYARIRLSGDVAKW